MTRSPCVYLPSAESTPGITMPGLSEPWLPACYVALYQLTPPARDSFQQASTPLAARPTAWVGPQGRTLAHRGSEVNMLKTCFSETRGPLRLLPGNCRETMSRPDKRIMGQAVQGAAHIASVTCDQSWQQAGHTVAQST